MGPLSRHYALLLGLGEDWRVQAVDLDLDAQRVEIRLQHNPDVRCACPECGVRNVHIPWAPPHGRFTLLFAAFAVRVLQASSSIDTGRRLLGLGWEARRRGS